VTKSSAAAPPGIIGTIRAELPVLVGVLTTAIFYTVGDVLLSDLNNHPLSGALFVWLFAVMVWCAFGVVRHAEALAHRLGEPYGTLILTIAVISIEVAIMAIVMLRGDPNPGASPRYRHGGFDDRVERNGRFIDPGRRGAPCSATI